jgi:hypothetical protein
MSTNSANRSVLILTVGAVLICLCLCALTIAGVFAFRGRVVQAVPALEPILSAAGQDTPTPTNRLNLARTPTPAPHNPTPLPTELSVITVPVATESGESAQATRTPAPTAGEPATTKASASTLPAEVARSMDEIQQQVIGIRGLQPSGTFTRDVLTSAQLRENVLNDFTKDTTPEDIRNEVIELSTLGLLEPGFDMGTFYNDLLSEQVAGYYDNKTKEMYVVGDQFGGMERMTYSHEYTHALQDQNFDIKNGLGYDTEPCKQDSERCAGIQALLEGDASMTEMDWFTQYATTQDYADIVQFYSTFQMPVYDSAPDYLKEDFMFPYTFGQDFVQHLFDQGGWAAVNAAYVDVPLSTEQILHPERYPDDRPVVVELSTFTTTLGTGWQEIDRGVMGEWYTYLILSKGLVTSYRLDDSTASAAAEGWGGDAYTAYYNEQSDQTVMVLRYEWDTLQDADEFARALVQYGRLRFGGPVASDANQTAWEYAGGYSIFRQAGQTSLWVLAPDQSTAEAVAATAAP